MIDHREQILRRVIQRALVTPISLALLTGAFVCAWMPATWPVALIALLAEGGVLQLLIRDAHFVRAIRDDEQRAVQDRQSEQIARLRQQVDWETAEMLGRIHSLQEQLLQESGGEDGAARASFEISRGQIASLVDRCVHLGEKRHRLRGYLAAARPADLQRQASHIEAKLENTSDPIARQLYAEALEQKRGELENYCAIEQAVQRIDGQLNSIECGFGNLLGKLIRLKSVSGSQAMAAQTQVTRELNELSTTLTALESSVNEMLALDRRA